MVILFVNLDPTSKWIETYYKTPNPPDKKRIVIAKTILKIHVYSQIQLRGRETGWMVIKKNLEVKVAALSVRK